MIITEKQFTPAPEGLWDAVCVDAVDLGLMENKFDDQHGMVHKIRLVWEISELMEDGRRFTVSKMYTVSLHKKSTLRKDLTGWGIPAKNVDTEELIGKPCQILVQQSEKQDGTVYANVVSILKPKKLMVPSSDYIRKKDRPAQGPITDSDVPF